MTASIHPCIYLSVNSSRTCIGVGYEEGRGEANADRMVWGRPTGRTSRAVQFTYVGAASDPLVTGAPDIDINGVVTVKPTERNLRFTGRIDGFPHFEMYCQADDRPAVAVFQKLD